MNPDVIWLTDSKKGDIISMSVGSSADRRPYRTSAVLTGKDASEPQDGEDRTQESFCVMLCMLPSPLPNGGGDVFSPIPGFTGPGGYRPPITGPQERRKQPWKPA